MVLAVVFVAVVFFAMAVCTFALLRRFYLVVRDNAWPIHDQIDAPRGDAPMVM